MSTKHATTLPTYPQDKWPKHEAPQKCMNCHGERIAPVDPGPLTDSNGKPTGNYPYDPAKQMVHICMDCAQIHVTGLPASVRFPTEELAAQHGGTFDPALAEARGKGKRKKGSE